MHVKKNLKQMKQDLRRQYRLYRENLPQIEKKKMDGAVFNRLIHLPAYQENHVILTYVSKPIEVDTTEIIRYSLLQGKCVAVPRCIPNTYQMQFYFIQSLNDLEPGTFGVLEPAVERCKPVCDLHHGLCIVPGLSFDSKGYRLGYGKGYYDRFLASFGGETVGICYRACISGDLPHGFYDRKVDVLITEDH